MLIGHNSEGHKFDPNAPYRVYEDGRGAIWRDSRGLFPEQAVAPKLLKKLKAAWPTVQVTFDRSLGYWRLWDVSEKYNVPQDIMVVKGKNGEFCPLDERIVRKLCKGIQLAQREKSAVAFDQRLEAEDKARVAYERECQRQERLKKIDDRITAKTKSNWDKGIIWEDPVPPDKPILSIPGMSPDGSRVEGL